MDPITISALIGAGGSLAAGGMNLLGQSRQQGNAEQSLQLAMQDYQLRKRQLEQQYELETAGQTDSRGNQVRYVPGRGWVTDLTPQSQSMLNQSDALQRQGYTEQLGRGTDERRQAFNRRQTEGSAASPLLDQMRFGYGAPTRAGVIGSSKIADVTGASEGADQARGGYTAAALRTGGGTVPLQNTIASIDRGATTGIRSALARGDAGGGQLYQAMTDQFNQGKLNPYNMLATRASNVENMPFSPENVTNSLDSAMASKSGMATMANTRGLGATQGAMTPIMAAMLGQKTPNYDTFLGGLTENAKQLYGAYTRNQTDPRNIYVGDGTGGF